MDPVVLFNPPPNSEHYNLACSLIGYKHYGIQNAFLYLIASDHFSDLVR